MFMMYILQRMCDHYRKLMEGEFDEKVCVVELSLLDKSVYIFMQNWIEHNLRKAIPSNRHVRTIISSSACHFHVTLIILALQNTHMVCIGKMASELRKVLDVRNSIVGHACLLDREGLVRWTAHATPTQSELQAMTKCTKDLLAGH